MSTYEALRKIRKILYMEKRMRHSPKPWWASPTFRHEKAGRSYKGDRTETGRELDGKSGDQAVPDTTRGISRKKQLMLVSN